MEFVDHSPKGRASYMKKIAAVIMVILMLMISLNAFSADRLNFNGNTIKEKFVSFEVTHHAVEVSLNRYENQLEYLYSQHGKEYSNMKDSVLKQLIDVQLNYASNMQTMVDGLKRVYFVNFTGHEEPIESKMNRAVLLATKNCKLIDKFASRCLDGYEALVFKAKYLELQIQELETLSESIESQINEEIRQHGSYVLL